VVVVSLAALVSAALLLAGTGRHGDRTCSTDGPNTQGGKLKPFQRGRPTTIKLGSSEEKVLDAGDLWYATEREGNVGSGRAVVDVAAPTDVIWGQLLDFNAYAGKVPKVSKCEIYERRKEGRTERIYAHFVSPLLPGYKFEYYCDHTYEPSKNSLTWSLDYDKVSDFEDVQGHWHVERHPTKPDWSRVFYEVQLLAPPYLPSVLVNILTTKAIKDATAWVRTFSEKEAARLAPKSRAKKEPVAA